MEYLEVNKLAYDQTASEFKEKSRERTIGDQRIVNRFIKYINKSSEVPTILELGPGAGNVSKLLCQRGYRVTAIEFSEKMAEIAKETAPDMEIIIDEFLDHNFQDRQYSGIVAVAFIHLFPSEEAEKVIKKIYSLLEDKGVACISTTKHQYSDEGYAEKINFRSAPKRYRKKYTQDNLEVLLTKAKFKIIKCYEEEDNEISKRVWLTYILEK